MLDAHWYSNFMIEVALKEVQPLKLPRLSSLAKGNSQQLHKLVPELQRLQQYYAGLVEERSKSDNLVSKATAVVHFHFILPYEGLRQIILRAKRDDYAEVKVIPVKFFDTQDQDLTLNNFWFKLDNGKYSLRYPIDNRPVDGTSARLNEANDDDTILAVLRQHFEFLRKCSSLEEITSRLEVLSEFEAQRITISESSTASLYFESVKLPQSNYHYWIGTLSISGECGPIPNIPCFAVRPVRSKVMEDIHNRIPALYEALVRRYTDDCYVSELELNRRERSLCEELDLEFSVPRDDDRLKRMGLDKWPILHHDFLDDFEYDLDV